MSIFARLFGGAGTSSAEDSRVTIDGTPFRLVRNVAALRAAVESEGKGVLRFPSRNYADVLRDVLQDLETRFGKGSPQCRDVIPSPLLCAGCQWEFPASYRMSLQMGASFGKMSVVGGTPGFDKFGSSGRCPKCGNTDSLLVYECFRAEQISERDVEAIRRYWRALAVAWWQTETRQQAICDRCNDTVQRGEGYVDGSELRCDKCVRDGLLKEGLEKLRGNPHYYGGALLRKARSIA